MRYSLGPGTLFFLTRALALSPQLYPADASAHQGDGGGGAPPNDAAAVASLGDATAAFRPIAPTNTSIAKATTIFRDIVTLRGEEKLGRHSILYWIEVKQDRGMDLQLIDTHLLFHGFAWHSPDEKVELLRPRAKYSSRSAGSTVLSFYAWWYFFAGRIPVFIAPAASRSPARLGGGSALTHLSPTS